MPKTHTSQSKLTCILEAFSFCSISLRSCFFTSTTALRQTSLRKMQGECVVGLVTEAKRRGFGALKLAYLKWAVKKPACPPELARARAECCSLEALSRGDGETMTWQSRGELIVFG